MKVHLTPNGAAAEEVGEDEIMEAIEVAYSLAKDKFPGKLFHVTAQECDAARSDAMPDGYVNVRTFSRPRH